jgi:preprotein translocase subunit SecG
VFQSVVIFVHAVLALAIIGVVLMQRGKGADAGAGFGSGASGTVFGARGSATFLSKATAVLITLFFITSLTLAYMAAHRPKTAEQSVLDQAAPAVPVNPTQVPTVPAPAVPAAPAPAGQ